MLAILCAGFIARGSERVLVALQITRRTSGESATHLMPQALSPSSKSTIFLKSRSNSY